MTTERAIRYYRNDKTGELAPPHLIGRDEEGRSLYQFVAGWSPADKDGVAIKCEQDYDGNWIA